MHRKHTALVAACLLGQVAACSSASPSTAPSQTVTVTPTAGAPSPTTPKRASSDVVGRGYDAGTVRSVRTVARTLVLELDRYTVNGTTDDALARDGLRMTPHTGDRFTNQNDSNTYTVPVTPGAQLVVNECVATSGGLGLSSTPEDAAGWLKDPDRTSVLLITLDEKGRATRFDTDPRC